MTCRHVMGALCIDLRFSFSSNLLRSWITLEQGKTTADAMGDVWRGLEVVEAASRVGSEMLVRYGYCVQMLLLLRCTAFANSTAFLSNSGGFAAKSGERA